MRKSLALLATTGALVAAAAIPAYAAPAPVSFTDAVGDVVNSLDDRPVSASAIAAADIQSVTFTAAAKSLRVTWTVPKVDATVNLDAAGFAQSYIAVIGKASKGKSPSKMTMVNISNIEKGVTTATKAGSKTCKTAKASFTATTATATVPYRCLPGWAKTKVVYGAQVMAANETGLFSDSAGDWEGLKLGR